MDMATILLLLLLLLLLFRTEWSSSQSGRLSETRTVGVGPYTTCTTRVPIRLARTTSAGDEVGYGG